MPYHVLVYLHALPAGIQAVELCLMCRYALFLFGYERGERIGLFFYLVIIVMEESCFYVEHVVCARKPVG